MCVEVLHKLGNLRIARQKWPLFNHLSAAFIQAFFAPTDAELSELRSTCAQKRPLVFTSRAPYCCLVLTLTGMSINFSANIKFNGNMFLACRQPDMARLVETEENNVNCGQNARQRPEKAHTVHNTTRVECVK